MVSALGINTSSAPYIGAHRFRKLLTQKPEMSAMINGILKSVPSELMAQDVIKFLQLPTGARVTKTRSASVRQFGKQLPVQVAKGGAKAIQIPIIDAVVTRPEAVRIFEVFYLFNKGETISTLVKKASDLELADQKVWPAILLYAVALNPDKAKQLVALLAKG